MFGIDVAEKQSVVLIFSIRIALEHTCESGDLASAKCTLVCSLCSIGVGTQIGKWWFGLSQMHTFVFIVFSLCCSGMEHKCESGGLDVAKSTFCVFVFKPSLAFIILKA